MTPFHGTIFHHFSRMRSKVRFAFHSSLDVAQPFAAVRNRPQPFAWGRYSRASGEGYKSGHFWRFQTLHNSVSCGRRGTSWHANMFHNVSKVVLCDRRNTFASFSEDSLHFSWQVQHFGDIRVHFASQLHHFRRVAFFIVILFFANRIVRVASSGDNVQIAWQPWGMRVSFGVASAAFGEDLSCVDCHFVKLVQYLGHSALYTLHSTLYTLHSTYTCHSHSTLYTLHF